MSKKLSISKRYTINKNETAYKTILLQGVRFIITVNDKGHIEVLENQSLLIKNGIIVERGPAEAVGRELDPKTVDLIYDDSLKGGIVVTPGFINMHAHPPMYLLRSTLTFAEDDLEEALAGMAALEGKMNAEDYYLGALGDFTEEQKSGITTTLSHYGTFEGIERAAKEAGQEVINCLSAASNSHPENTPALVEQYLQQKGTFTTPGIALHRAAKASPNILKQIKKLLAQFPTFFTLHVAETEEEVKQCLAIHGQRPLGVLERYGLLGPQTIISHAVHLTQDEIELIKKTGTVVAHLPTSNLLHRSGRFDYKTFCAVGADKQITLGTDSVVSKNRLDLLSEALAMKTLHQAHEIVSYEDLFRMLTSRPAELLGRKTGKIVPGYQADIAFWKLRDRGLTPYDEDNPATLISNMITHGGRGVRDLMIKGKFIISNRYHNLVDESKLLSKLQKAHMALRKR